MAKIPSTFWEDDDNCRDFIESLITTDDDYYTLTVADLVNAGGYGIRKRFGGSVRAALYHLYPDKDWRVFDFKYQPNGFWKDPQIHRDFFDWMQLNGVWQTAEDLYSKITQKSMTDFGGGRLASGRFGTISDLITASYPEYDLKPYKFKTVTKNYWTDFENHKLFLNSIIEKQDCGMEYLYTITKQEIIDEGGGGLLANYYNNSPTQMVLGIFPEYDWIPWKFSMTALLIDVEDPQQATNFFEYLRENEVWDEIDDLPGVTIETIHKNGGSCLINHYDTKLELFQAAYPGHDWSEKIRTFEDLNRKPRLVSESKWGVQKNVVAFFEAMKQQGDWNNLEDLYHLDRPTLLKYQGSYTLLAHHGGFIETVMAAYPDYNWNPFLFSAKSQSFWNLERGRLWFELQKENGVWSDFEDLYHIGQQWFEQAGMKGMGLYRYFGESPFTILTTIFPEYNWIPFKLPTKPQGFWDDIENHRAAIDWLKDEGHWTDFSDLCFLTQKDCNELGISGLLGKYNGSPCEMIMTCYPEANYSIFDFTPVSAGTWQDDSNVLAALEWLKSKGVWEELEDLYSLSKDELLSKPYRLHGLMNKFNGSISEMVMFAYPEYDWQVERFSSQKKTQGLLYRFIKQKYPLAVWEPKTELRYPSGTKIGADIFIPELNLMVEGQGFQHYTYKEGFMGGQKSHERTVKNDQIKRTKFLEAGYQILYVPFCKLDPELPKWDRTEQSLLEIAFLQGIEL